MVFKDYYPPRMRKEDESNFASPMAGSIFTDETNYFIFDGSSKSLAASESSPPIKSLESV